MPGDLYPQSLKVPELKAIANRMNLSGRSKAKRKAGIVDFLVRNNTPMAPSYEQLQAFGVEHQQRTAFRGCAAESNSKFPRDYYVPARMQKSPIPPFNSPGRSARGISSKTFSHMKRPITDAATYFLRRHRWFGNGTTTRHDRSAAEDAAAARDATQTFKPTWSNHQPKSFSQLKKRN